jgi:alpha-ribazole phosphatase CobZ
MDRKDEMWDRLAQKGIERGEMLDTVLQLYVPHPGIEDRGEAKRILGGILDGLLKDPNINALLLAAVHLEEVGSQGSIPGLSRERYEEDPVFLVADEILGMAIAEYIGGTRARFEYVRFDMGKPGILGRLPPFLDDALCGVLAGASTRMYTEALEKEEKG